MTTYGIISDMHQIHLSAVSLAIQVLKSEGIDALVLNGDLFGERSGFKPQDYLANVLNLAGQSELETHVVRGSHEEVHIFEPVLAHFLQKYGNLVDTLDHPQIDRKDHHLLFLHGSDAHAGGALYQGYVLNKDTPSGFYQHQKGTIRIVNIEDLKKQIVDPEKTILFSHVPRKFNNPETGVDMAEFGIVENNFFADIIDYKDGERQIRTYLINGEQGTIIKPKPVESYVRNSGFQEGAVLPLEIAKHFVAAGAPIKLKRENRGNEDLAKIYEELGIKINVTGHFHESAGRAHDLQGAPVEEGLFVSNLFYNASCLDRLMVGMLSVSDNKAAYENIDLRKYLK